MIEDEDDVAIAAVTLAELLVGVELATGKRRRRRQEYVNGLMDLVLVESYDAEVSRSHAKLLTWVRHSERPRGAHDLIIAATALARSRDLITADTTGFSDLPGVSLRGL
jgi:tRNA(fMet)-specific endonuclease VapC